MPTTRYRIEEPDRGRGGFGRVARGFDTILERPVAIKTLDPLLRDASDTDRERFQREARILASLRHPHIPSIYDVEFGDNEFRIVFEFIEGTCLRDLINEDPPGLHAAQPWFVQVAAALDHAHQRGVIHRDVKPDNIIVAQDQTPHAYLVDFGIALSLTDQRRVSTSGQVLGTPGYMSPEQENGEELDASADVYSLGVTLYEALCGHRIPAGDYEELSTQNETIPPAIDALILNCISQKYQRIENALEFARRLLRAVHVRPTLSDVLVEGHLHEIISALREMDANEFMQIKAGQRLLVLNKALDVVENEDQKLDRARMEFLRILPRLAVHVEPNRYRQIILRALEVGFEKPSGKWMGDVQIRDALKDASEDAQSNHGIIVEELLQYLVRETRPDQAGWFYHAIREIITRLMANSSCTEDHAAKLDAVLQHVNKLQREREPPLELPSVAGMDRQVTAPVPRLVAKQTPDDRPEPDETV